MSIDAMKGGRTALIYGRVEDSGTYDTDDGRRAKVTVAFFGDSVRFTQLETDHPLAKCKPGTDVMVTYEWADRVYDGRYSPRIRNINLVHADGAPAASNNAA